MRRRGEEEGKGTGGEGEGRGGDPLPTSRGRRPQASWEFCGPGRSRLPSQASGNCVSPSRFMNHRVPAHRRYQPTEYEHAANCATHAVSLGGLTAKEGGWGRSLFALGEIVCPFHGNVPSGLFSSLPWPLEERVGSRGKVIWGNWRRRACLSFTLRTFNGSLVPCTASRLGSKLPDRS